MAVRRRRRRRGRPVRPYELVRLHSDGERARRTGLLFTVAARLLVGAAMLLGAVAAVLLWWRPGPDGQRQALVLGGAGLCCGGLWVVVLGLAARWLRRGVIAGRGSGPAPATGLMPDNCGEPESLWDTLRLAHLVALCVPLSGLVLAVMSGASGEATGEVALMRWGVSGFGLLLTGLMGGIIGGLAFGMVDSSEAWTPRGAARRLSAYAVPYLLAAPWLAGLHAAWSSVLVAAGVLWLLIAPVNQAAGHIPGTSSAD
ncbi:hypothetical protein ACIGEZ_33480 [Streptomyces sp. NPDC085481]|uniref:hypothetical protein n=1 Tax=Streptomyces sp. NPDC085481 TaxID=3365727 RepID=UPI0037CF0947